MDMLILRCRKRTQVAEDMAEQWKIAHVEAMAACDADELLAECIELGELIRRGWNRVLDRFFSENVKDVDGEGKSIKRLVKVVLRLYRRVATIANSVLRGGHDLDHVAKFRAIVENMQQLSVEIEKAWPKDDEELFAMSRAASERGELCSSLDQWLCNAKDEGAEAN
jgi:hypothetical protein